VDWELGMQHARLAPSGKATDQISHAIRAHSCSCILAQRQLDSSQRWTPECDLKLLCVRGSHARSVRPDRRGRCLVSRLSFLFLRPRLPPADLHQSARIARDLRRFLLAASSWFVLYKTIGTNIDNRFLQPFTVTQSQCVNLQRRVTMKIQDIAFCWLYVVVVVAQSRRPMPGTRI
jgi:hypothetical protein